MYLSGILSSTLGYVYNIISTVIGITVMKQLYMQVEIRSHCTDPCHSTCTDPTECLFQFYRIFSTCMYMYLQGVYFVFILAHVFTLSIFSSLCTHAQCRASQPVVRKSTDYRPVWSTCVSLWMVISGRRPPFTQPGAQTGRESPWGIDYMQGPVIIMTASCEAAAAAIIELSETEGIWKLERVLSDDQTSGPWS